MKVRSTTGTAPQGIHVTGDTVHIYGEDGSGQVYRLCEIDAALGVRQ